MIYIEQYMDILILNKFQILKKNIWFIFMEHMLEQLPEDRLRTIFYYTATPTTEIIKEAISADDVYLPQIEGGMICFNHWPKRILWLEPTEEEILMEEEIDMFRRWFLLASD